jgi:hypothetical protein
MRIGLLSLAAIASIPALAVIVDRVAVSVGAQAITESDITRRIRLAAFQNGLLPDFSLASRRAAARSLIDLKLVEHEMELGHYERTTPARAAELLAAFTAEHFRSSGEAVRLSLAAMDLTPADLQAELAEQADLLSFTNLRFRPAVEISAAETEEYFRSHIESLAGSNPVALADVRANIEQILASQHADRDLDAWLRDQRMRTRIVYLIKELQ